MLINMALKTWVFPKADNNMYYAPQVAVCPELSEADKDTNVYVAPECSDPSYAEKEIARAQDDRSAQKQRDASQALAMIIVATPVFLYHWKLARKEA